MLERMIRWLCNIVLVVALFLVLALTAPRLFGVKTFAITSGSMEPGYPIGSIVFAVPADPEQITEGDVISFRMGSVTATHRVIEVNREDQCFATKGDANENADGAPVSYDRVIGRVALMLPLLGYVSMWLTPKKLLLLLIPLVILILLPSKKEKAA